MENAPELKAASAATSAGQTYCSVPARGGGVNRRTLYIGLSIGAAAGLFLGWDWLVAIGAASVIIALAPCLIMCGVMCAMHKCLSRKTEVPATADSVNADAPVTITKTAADEAAITSAAETGVSNAAAPATQRCCP